MTSIEAAKILAQQGLRPPKTLTVSITGACNLKCRHCWVDAGRSSSAPHVPENELCRIIDDFAAFGGTGVRFTGGEPLCHPAWLELIKYSAVVGLKSVSLQTNGILFTDREAIALRGLEFPQLSIQVSLDGALASTHDLVRGDGAFAAVMAGLRSLARGGLAQNVTIFFTEMRHNLQEIPTLLNLADELGVGSVVTGSLVLCGRAAEESVLAPPTSDQYLDLLCRYEASPRFRELYGKIGKVAALEWQFETLPRNECCTFVENPYLTASGRLYPCVLCHTDDYSVTGVYDNGFADVMVEGASLWASLLRKSQCRREVLQECLTCPGKSSCAGGCMGRAWGSSSDLLEADDRCNLRKTIYQRKEYIRAFPEKTFLAPSCP